jgi:N-acylneuraminate cytidylyltransferase
MNKDVSIFLPTRAGSERIANKNTRNFAGVEGGLLAIKLEQLLSLFKVKEVVLSTNDQGSIKVAQNFLSNPKLKLIQRPDHLAQSHTNLIDLVDYVPSVCNSEHILWTHVTSPLVNAEDYEVAIDLYFEKIAENYDSLMSVKEIQNYVWSEKENKVLNKKDGDFKKWPRTQDLEKIFEVNSAIFMASKTVYKEEEDRVGVKPYLLTHNSLQSVDVDWEEDFKIAEQLYKL